MLRRRTTISSPDTRALRRPRIRTGIVRVALVLAACGLLAAAVLSARGLEPHDDELVPGGKSGIVVMDLSLSIIDRDYGVMRATLEKVIESGNPMGLVVFSDTPYEMLPPRTPAKELKPLLRFFTLDGGELPPHPWAEQFSGGTVVSLALDLAHEMIRRDRVSPASILLLSDLATAPDDYTPLGRTLARLRDASVTVRIVPLSATGDDLAFFSGILGPETFVDPIEPSTGRPRPVDVSLSGNLPLVLLLASALIFFALAAHERFAGRLALPSRPWRAST